MLNFSTYWPNHIAVEFYWNSNLWKYFYDDKNSIFLHPEKKETIFSWRIFWAGFLLKENGLAFMRHDCYEREKKIDGIILVPRNDFIRREEMKMGLKNIQLCRYYLHIKNVGCQHFSLFLQFKKKKMCVHFVQVVFFI